MEWQTVFLTIGGAAISFLGLWCAHTMNNQRESAVALWNALNAFRAEVAQYKLEVAKEFASEDHLREVEDRMVKALEGISTKMDKLIEAFHDHILWERKQYERKEEAR